jgi:nitronate monooxygenase
VTEVLTSPVVLAPMAGGPGTVDLAVAVAESGGFPLLAGAYVTPDRLAADIEDFRSRSSSPFGVNVFAPSPDEPGMQPAARAYAARLAPWAAAAGVGLGEPTYDDDSFAAKVALLDRTRPHLVSFSFGWPPATVVDRLQQQGIRVWVTINEATEVAWAETLAVDGLVAQGWEAGGHRGGPVDGGAPQPPVRQLVDQVRRLSDLPLIAAGGVTDGVHAARLLAAGADAVAFGTAYLDAEEAGTAEVHRHALHDRPETVVTRCFTGRSARALRNGWTDLFGDSAPAAYPHVHHVTAPLRAHGRATGEADLVHLWAGTGHASARRAPAGVITRDLLSEIRAVRARQGPEGHDP